MNLLANREYPLYNIREFNSFYELLKDNACYNPSEIAFGWWENKKIYKETTYLEFYTHVLNTVAMLQEKHYKGEHIGIIGENSYYWIVLYLAIIISGNICVVLDKDMPEKEFYEIIDDMDVSIIYTDDYIDYTIDDKCAKVCKFEEIEKIVDENVYIFDTNTIIPYKHKKDELACIFLTSGTTGKRKGVMLSENNMIYLLYNASKLFNPEGNMLAVLPFHHSFGLITTLFGAVYSKVVYISKGLRYIPKEMEVTKPTCIFVVPLFIESFSKKINKSIKDNNKEKQFAFIKNISNLLLKCHIDMRRKIFKKILTPFGGNLKILVSGGAALNDKYAEEFKNYGINILSGYGTTECSPVISVDRNYYHKGVGLPVPGTEVKIENNEVIVHGENVMLGYYKNEEETDKVLKDGWYYTGDIGYIDEDGFVFLNGRIKNLIILSNGENVSPEELENEISLIEDIEEVVVYAENNVITAEIYSEKLNEDVKQKIKNQINEYNKTLENYKRINNIVFRETPFDKTTSKKIIRKR